MDKSDYTINALKYDGNTNRRWSCQLQEKADSLLVFTGEFDREITHPDIGIIRRGTLSYEFYWLDRWYNIFRFHEPEGSLRNFYCNINLPPVLEERTLSYVDLDIDILVWENFDYQILDVDEFERNALRYNYPPQLIKKVYESIDELIELIEKRQFPFDFVNQKP